MKKKRKNESKRIKNKKEDSVECSPFKLKLLTFCEIREQGKEREKSVRKRVAIWSATFFSSSSSLVVFMVFTRSKSSDKPAETRREGGWAQ